MRHNVHHASSISNNRNLPSLLSILHSLSNFPWKSDTFVEKLVQFFKLFHAHLNWETANVPVGTPESNRPSDEPEEEEPDDCPQHIHVQYTLFNTTSTDENVDK